MAPPSSSQLKHMISQFVGFTGANERVAAKFIKASGYRVNEAVDEYFHTQGGSKGPSPVESQLDALFDSLRDDKNDAKDRMEVDSTMTYLGTFLNINLENAELFVALELLQSPGIGEITRKGYVDGWKEAEIDASHKDHSQYLRMLITSLPNDTLLFRKVYKYAFVVGRERDQKALSLENALVYWNMLFAPPGMKWENEHRNWLELWKAFLAEKWTRSVNRDMWNMTLEFALKSIQDDSLSFWSEDGAWPSVIDDFVKWCRANVIGKSDQMDVDGE